ncbi:MAG: ATP-grasp domain-containing protein [Filomicrobium sp.]
MAQAAQRAGFTPLVVDCFGDVDTRAAAGAVETLPDALRRGFEANPLAVALERLCNLSGNSEQASDVPDLVLGPGFEDRPKLVEALGEKFKLAGCGSRSIERSKDPNAFFGLLKDEGILHPETVIERPAHAVGWLSKRTGGCGGRHIRRLKGKGAARRHRYYQRELKGETLSATAIASSHGTAFAFTQSWCNPYKWQPFRYGGSVSMDGLDADLEARVIDTCLSLIKPLDLVGLVSFDFIIDEAGDAFLVEVNPRPGASLDVLDDDEGTLFNAHMAACRGEDAVGVLAGSWKPRPTAAAYLYADNGPLRIRDIPWPDWVRDIPALGTEIATGNPVATVVAQAENAQEAAEICRDRVARLSAVLYES